MMIAIRAHDLGNKTDINTLLKKTSEIGFEGIQLVFKKALSDYPIFTKENALKVKEALENSNVKISMLGAYFNPVHSNKELVRNNVEYFKEHLKYASLLNCKYVGTETGSYNDDKWTYNPKNQTEEGYLDTMSVFKELMLVANEYKTTILMEPAWGHVIYSVSQLKRAYDEINSPYLKVTIDIYNLLYIGNYKDYKQIFSEALSNFKDNVKIIHLKDFIVENDTLKQVGLGKGIIDFDFIISEVKKYCPNTTLVFEGVTGEDIIPSFNLIKSLM